MTVAVQQKTSHSRRSPMTTGRFSRRSENSFKFNIFSTMAHNSNEIFEMFTHRHNNRPTAWSWEKTTPTAINERKLEVKIYVQSCWKGQSDNALKISLSKINSIQFTLKRLRVIFMPCSRVWARTIFRGNDDISGSFGLIISSSFLNPLQITPGKRQKTTIFNSMEWNGTLSENLDIFEYNLKFPPTSRRAQSTQRVDQLYDCCWISNSSWDCHLWKYEPKMGWKEAFFWG